MQSNKSARSFKPWPENQERLDYAQRLGLEVSQVVNDVLKEHLRPYLEKVRKSKTRELREVLDAPVP